MLFSIAFFGWEIGVFQQTVVRFYCILKIFKLKLKTSAHAQIAITHYYRLCKNFLTWHEFETYIEDTFW